MPENALQYVVCKIVAIPSRLHCIELPHLFQYSLYIEYVYITRHVLFRKWWLLWFQSLDYSLQIMLYCHTEIWFVTWSLLWCHYEYLYIFEKITNDARILNLEPWIHICQDYLTGARYDCPVATDVDLGSGSLKIPMLTSMLVNKDFQTGHFIGWLQSHQPIRGHVWKSLFTNMDFNIDFT